MELRYRVGARSCARCVLRPEQQGVALFDGKVCQLSLDGACPCHRRQSRPGLRKAKIAEWKEGYSINSAPSVVDRIVMSGMTGGAFGVRGFVVGLDAQTG